MAATTNCDRDGAIIVEICTTINYDYFTGGTCPSGFRCAAIQSTNNQFSRLDTAANSFQGKWVEGASGPCKRGCSGVLSGTYDFGWHAIAYGATLTYTGHWANQYTLLQDANSYQRGGTAYLDYYYRAHAYQFALTSHVPQ